MKIFSRKIVALSLISLCLILPEAAFAGSVDAAGATKCSLTGWSDDHDPSGLNIRAAPDKNGKIIGRIPTERKQGYDSFAAEFDIIGSRNGWFLISGVKFAGYGDGKGDKTIFPRQGWVFADKVRFLINNSDLRNAADRDAPVILKLETPDMSGGPDSANIDHVYGCAGDFADVAVHMQNGPHMRGWATGICSNQATTCP